MTKRNSSRRRTPLLLLCTLPCLGLAGPAAAHPHVWVDGSAELLFEDGAVASIVVNWLFDPVISATLVTDFDANGDGTFDEAEQAQLAGVSLEGMAEYGYFTHPYVDGTAVPVAAIADFTARIEGDRVAYRFAVPLPEPIDPRRARLTVGLYDEEFFMSFAYADPAAVLSGAGAEGCATTVREDSDHPIYFGFVLPQVIDVVCETS
jgi:ABC-type uncharacterized transport system substrate-binding protein